MRIPIAEFSQWARLNGHNASSSKNHQRMWKTLSIPLLLLLLAGGFALQQRSLNALNRRLDSLQRPSVTEDQVASLATARRPVDSSTQRGPDQQLGVRLTALEDAVNELRRTSDYLMESGRAPLDDRMREEMMRRLSDPTTSTGERLRAFRLLRDGGALSETTVAAALSWLNGTTNGGLREDILNQLEGATNSALQSPLMQLALSDADEDVREWAISDDAIDLGGSEDVAVVRAHPAPYDSPAVSPAPELVSTLPARTIFTHFGATVVVPPLTLVDSAPVTVRY